MRIKELSAATELPVATLKYYLREGLLHPGVATAVNQAEYDDGHVRRVRLVRALLALGHLSIADARAVVDAVDDETLPIHEAFGIAQDAMVPHHDRSDATYADALAQVDDFVERHGLRVRPQAAVRVMLADALVGMGACASLGVGTAALDSMLPTILAAAEFEVATTPADATRAEQVEHVVVGTVAYEVALNALRRMALEHASASRFGTQRARSRIRSPRSGTTAVQSRSRSMR